MRTFTLDGGDLSLRSGSFETVTGAQKLEQDLGLALREPFGSDRFHPRWGSDLHSYVGLPEGEHQRARVMAEVQRVLTNYMAVQRDKITDARTQGRALHYGSGEIISTIKGIDVTQRLDRLMVRISLSTLSGADLVLMTSVGT